MQINAEHSDLKNIPVDRIDRNPDNPRIVFRQGELEQLLESIRKHGVQVPISVYPSGRRYVLIDGERRWRCCIKLNKGTVPALIQTKPDALTNLLLMFNIHALREQWDLLTIALKLPSVISLLQESLGRLPKEREIAEHTGLKPGLIRRCKTLLDLPEQHRDMLLQELKKPKLEQKLTEDFFIEMERALKTVERAMPGSIPNKDVVRSILIEKFRGGTIRNRTDFRLLPKIAKAEKVDADPKRAALALRRVFDHNRVSIDEAYKSSVSDAYFGQDLLSRTDALLERLLSIDASQFDENLRDRLVTLVKVVNELLEGSE